MMAFYGIVLSHFNVKTRFLIFFSFLYLIFVNWLNYRSMSTMLALSDYLWLKSLCLLP